MRTPTFVASISLCILSLGLAGCGGGGGDTSTQSLPTWPVTNLNDAGPGSLRDAIANAPPGAWIVFDPGLATGTITLSSPLVINRPTRIGGLSSTLERFTISGNNAVRIFEVDPGSTLDLHDLILTEGHGGGQGGGAIYGQSTPIVMRRVTIAACHAPGDGGGAVSLNGGTFVMTDSAVNGCTASWGGAFHLQNVWGHIERCSFHLNSANVSSGGALHLTSGTYTVINSTFNANKITSPGGSGGAITLVSDAFSGSIHLMLWASTVSSNVATNGGGVYVLSQGGAPATLVTQYSIIASNNATSGPDLLFDGGATAGGNENVIGVSDGAFFSNGLGHNAVGSVLAPLDPMLGGVSWHSFGRAKRAPLPGSPALDTVTTPTIPRPNGLVLTEDQQGAARAQGAAPNKGAVEQ